MCGVRLYHGKEYLVSCVIPNIKCIVHPGRSRPYPSLPVSRVYTAFALAAGAAAFTMFLDRLRRYGDDRSAGSPGSSLTQGP
eukprot:scaffold106447_cov59-Phaeocystis_antarctica.AAC.3